MYEAVLQEMTVFYVASMSEVARVSYFENYIDTLKKKDEAKEF
jgi:hypothetical protein